VLEGGGEGVVRGLRRFGRFFCGEQENKDEIAEEEEERRVPVFYCS
jgi:hypothetical protein